MIGTRSIMTKSTNFVSARYDIQRSIVQFPSGVHCIIQSSHNTFLLELKVRAVLVQQFWIAASRFLVEALAFPKQLYIWSQY